MKKIIYLLLFPVIGYAQAVNNHVGKVSLPTPDASSLGKFGDIPMDYFTGVPSIEVPIHTIESGSLRLSIIMQHHSSGLRPAETPSWVGHGWALNAGGIISRTVQGIEDEYANGFLSQGSQTTFNGTCFTNPSVSNPLTGMLNGQLDGEPDIFSYSVGAISGKFYLNSTGEVIKVPENDLKITYSLGSSMSDFYRLKQFVITATDGTIYTFGENTTGYKAIELSRVNQSPFKTASSWKLVRIESADGNYSIDLNYTSEVYSYGNRDKNGIFGGSGNSFNKVEIEGHRLVRIVSSTNRDVVTFTPSATVREDVFGLISGSNTAYALDRIEIQNGFFCKKFQLSYQYTLDNTPAAISVNNENKKRLLLNSVQEKSCDNAISIPAYSFVYDIVGTYLPHKLTAGTDEWGFYNGAEDNKNFVYNIPYTLLEYSDGVQTITALQGGANKKANNSFSKLGSLIEMNYPTGGRTTYEYEGNSVYDTVRNLDFTYLPQSAFKASCSNVSTDFAEFTTTLSNVSSTYFELNAANTGNSFYCCNSSSGSPLSKWVVFTIRQGSTQLYSKIVNLSCGEKNQLRGLLPLTLQNGIAYTFRINPLNAQGEIKLMVKTQSISYENKEVGGLRIKKIRHHDAIDSNRDVVKEYDYLDPVFISRSSGILYNKPLYGFIKQFATTCNPGVPRVNFTTHFFFDFSPVPLSTFEGHTVAYKSVKESTPGAGFKRFNYFYVPYQGYQELPYSPPQPGIRTGNLESESSYTALGDIKAFTFNSQKSDALTYNNTANGIFVKAYWGTNGGGSQTGLYKIYTIGSKPFRLATIENHNDGLTATTHLTYRNDKEHLFPIEIQTSHPDGTLAKQTIKYAKELNQTDLLNRHIIGIPLESQSYVNNVITGGQKINYSLFSAFPRRQTIQSYNTAVNSWETEATFNSYDAFGNPSSVTLRGWQPETYTWNQGLLTQKQYLDFQWQYEYEPNTTLLKKYTEPNGLFTQYAYDKLSRLRTIHQYSGKATTTIGYTYSPADNRIRVATDYQTGADLTTEKVLDGLGRTIQLRKIGYGQGGQDVVSQTDFDPAGRVKRDYLPGFGAASAAFTEYTYEDSPLSRPTSITRPAPLGVETMTYGNENNQFIQTLTNALGEYTQTFTDSRGRKRSTVQGKDGLLNTTQYQYDDRNNLVRVLPDGRTASDVDFIYQYAYDGRDRLIRKKIPEKAWMEMAYNLRDLPTHTQDGIHPVVFSAYDAYGRVTKSGTVSSLSSTTFIHLLSETEFKTTGFGFGQPYKNKYALFGANGLPNGTFIFSEVTQFDAFHRPVALAGNHILNLAQPTALTASLSFNARDQITSQSETVQLQGVGYTLAQHHQYDQGGRPTQTQVTWDGSTQTVEETTVYNALDNPLQTKLGGNLQTVDYSYWAGGFLHKINGGTTGNGGLAPTANDWPTENTNQPLFAMELTYLANGNIAHWKQQNRGFALQNHTYTYDALQRIRTATNGTQSQTYQYKDALGNFSSLTRSDLVRNNGAWNLQDIDALTYSYVNPISSKIQSVTDASNHLHGYRPNTGTYLYDANGNTTYDPANQISTVYNYLNLPSKFAKDDGARQEVIYDTAGTKWQEKTYDANGNEIGKKTYLENMEFEGNELSLVHHPTGFVRKLNSANHLSGTQRGSVQGNTITSTQKIEDGRYEAAQQICLLPGFEATAADKFSATIQPQTTYQWQYVLKDHLGNQRVLFTDKDNDGLIRQSSDESPNEVLAMRQYSPFGLELGGSHQNIGYQNPYRFTGQEENSFTGYYDFGARWSDPTIGNRFLQIDPLAGKREWVSPYNFVQNNPINRIDPDGALDEPLYKKAWNYVSSWFSGSDATRNTQSVAATTSYTLVKSQEVRTEYVTRVASLDKTDSQGRTQAKMEARAKTPAVMREVAEQMRPSSGESTRVGGTASKTNAGVNNMVGTLSKVGKVAGVTAIGVSVYNVATAENKPQAVATEGGAFVGAIAGGELGAETGAAIGVWFGGAGAVPGAIIGGIIGSIGGGIIGANAGTSTYNAVTTKKEDKK